MVLELEDLFQKNGYSETDFRIDMAILVYQRKVATLNRAARLAGLSLKAFEQILTDKNIKRLDNNAQPAIASEKFQDTSSIQAPLHEAIKPIRSTITIEDLIKDQNYQGTNWDKLNKIAQNMAIEEPIEVLLAQLKD
jgi:predicted HTH domain antitoxin